MANTLYDEKNPIVFISQIDNAAGTTSVSAFFAAPFTSRCDHMYVSNDDTIDHDLEMIVNWNTFDRHLSSVTVPAGSGYAGVPPLDIILHGLPDLPDGVILDNVSALFLRAEVVVTSGKLITCVAMGAYL